MQKFLITLAILGAIAVMLAQIIEPETIKKEYAPVIDMFSKAKEKVTESKVVEAPAVVEERSSLVEAVKDAKEQPEWVPETKVEVDPDDPEITAAEYGLMDRDWCHPNYRFEVKQALENDGIITESEYWKIQRKCNAYANRRSEVEKEKAELIKALEE